MLSSLSPKCCVLSHRPQIPTGRLPSSRKAYLRSVSSVAVPVVMLSQKSEIQHLGSISNHAEAKPRRQVWGSQQNDVCLADTQLLFCTGYMCSQQFKQQSARQGHICKYQRASTEKSNKCCSSMQTLWVAQLLDAAGLVGCFSYHPAFLRCFHLHGELMHELGACDNTFGDAFCMWASMWQLCDS